MDKATAVHSKIAADMAKAYPRQRGTNWFLAPGQYGLGVYPPL